MNLFVAGLLTETNSFAPCPTGLAAFEAEGLRRGPTSTADPLGMAPAVAAVHHEAAIQGWKTHEGLVAGAQSGGLVVAAAYEALRDEILADLTAAAPVDAVVLLLHGAMMAEGCDDCEGDLIAHVRALVGTNTPIGVALDLHCHLTEAMRAQADVIVAYKEYPHIDIPDTAARVTRLAMDTALGRIRPRLGVHDCRMMGLWPTNHEPMRTFVRKMRDLEGAGGILSISLGHGMSYGDTAEAGAKLWVIADGDVAKAADLARALGEDLFALRTEISTRYASVAEAMQALADWDGEKPLGVADLADNPGGGAMGDSTFLLAALLHAGLDRVALGGIWDPGAVQICREAGVGAALPLRIGGKSGPAAGDPVDVAVRVMALRDEHDQDDFGARAALGPSAWVRSESGLDIVLISRRRQVLGVDLFTGLGLDLAGLRGVVVKSMHHFQASFGPHLGGVMHVDTPGLMRMDFETIPFERRSLVYWPRCADPFSIAG